MKKNIFIAVFFLLLVCLINFSCKKNKDTVITQNSASITANGTALQADSVTTSVNTINSIKYISLFVYFHNNNNTPSALSLTFTHLLSNPAYATGSAIQLTTFSNSLVYSIYLDSNGNQFQDPSLNGTQGTITITKNDVTGRRIELTLSNMVEVDNSNANNTIILAGNIAATYPAT